MLVPAETVRITDADAEVACHRHSAGRRGRIVDPVHSAGLAGAVSRTIRTTADTSGADTVGAERDVDTPIPIPTLLRPLAE